MPGVSLAKFKRACPPAFLLSYLARHERGSSSFLPSFATFANIARAWFTLPLSPPRSDQRRFDNGSGRGTARAQPHSCYVSWETMSHSPTARWHHRMVLATSLPDVETIHYLTFSLQQRESHMPACCFAKFLCLMSTPSFLSRRQQHLCWFLSSFFWISKQENPCLLHRQSSALQCQVPPHPRIKGINHRVFRETLSMLVQGHWLT